MDQGLSQDGFPVLGEQTEQMTLFDMQSLVVKKTGSIQSLQEQIKTTNDMLVDALKNNPVYKEREDKVKEQRDVLATIKQQINSQPSVVALTNKVRDLRNELKEKRSEVSVVALEVYRKTGNTEFEQEGETYEIKTVARVVKRGKVLA